MKEALRYKDIGEMKKIVDTFRNGFRSLDVQLRNYKSKKADPGCTDSYKRFFGTFAEGAKPKVEEIVKGYQTMEAGVKALAKLLGEKSLDEEKKINTRYFQILADFYEHCHEVQKAMFDERKEKKKEKSNRTRRRPLV
eukprot:TRINITY_DN913_c0_g1_i1.p2 TRINITY_DN913_c0_g1~~TRINITY_DN913_c0_g1_i1.p2  ORF type:complete len:138 (+),score=48.22 TRINITY_DN913_c0_g1_i1:581-994(+)